MSLVDQLWFPTSVQVTVLQARGLRIKGKGGTNDAFAVMQVGKEKYQTTVAEKSVAPVWKEEATFDLPQLLQQPGGGGGTERSTLHVHVLHRALVGPDKLLGQAVINLLQLSQDKTRSKTEWFKLLDKTGKADKDRGEVLVDVQFLRNNMTASMFDLSAAGKSKSRLGKLKDKVRGKKKDSDVASTAAASFPQVLTDSEDEEGNGDCQVAAGKEEKKKKIKALFSAKSNLQRNMSQSMSVLPAKTSLSGSQSSGLNVDTSEGKKKFKFMIHKRSGSSGTKESSSAQQQAADQSNLCINGSHVYCEEPQNRTSRIGSNFSLASSGHGSMEDVPASSPPSVDSLRTTRQYSPWTEEISESVDEREEEETGTEKETEVIVEGEGGKRMEEEKRRVGEEENARRKEEERILEEEERRQEEEKRRDEKQRRHQEEEARMEEERIRVEKERREEEKMRLEEEERRLEEKARKVEEKRKQEEKRREEEEERKQREEEKAREEEDRRKETERRRVEKEERRLKEMARKEEERRKEMERKRTEEEEARKEEMRNEIERRRVEEEERAREEEELRKELERRRVEEEERAREEEELRKELERRRVEEEERAREEEELRKELERSRKEEEERAREEEELRKELERSRKEEEEKRCEENARREEERRKLEEEEKRRTEEESFKKEMLEKMMQMEEQRRQQETDEMEEKARRGEEEYVSMIKETNKQEEEKREKRIIEERMKEEDERFLAGNTEEGEKKTKNFPSEEQMKNVTEVKTDVVASLNPFDENHEGNPSFPAGTRTSRASVCSDPHRTQPAVSYQRTSSSDDKDHGGSQREKRPAPQPPGGTDITALLPQSSFQAISPVSRSDPQKTSMQTTSLTLTVNQANHGKGPAPARPKTSPTSNISKTQSSEAKQGPIAYGYNPFEGEEDDELTAQDEANAGSKQWPPAAASHAKIKSWKKAPAPPLPELSDTSSTPVSLSPRASDPDTHGAHLRDSCGPPKPATPQLSGGKDEPAATKRRLLPVKPLNSLRQSVNQGGKDTKAIGILSDEPKNTKVDPELKGPYSQLTKAELVSLVLKQEKQLLEKDAMISDLEQYIDNLLVRVMEEQPSILMSMKSFKKSV